MVSANNYRITTQDYSVAVGIEHYVIGVERLDIATNKWVVEAEFNGLATSSSNEIQPIGFSLSGDKIKTYIRINPNGQLKQKGYLNDIGINESVGKSHTTRTRNKFKR